MERTPTSKTGVEAHIHLKLGASAVPLRSHSGETFLSIPTGPTSQAVLPLRSRRAELWITANFYRAYETAPSPAAIQRALSVLHARALFDTTPQAIGRRLIGKPGAIVLDLANDSGQCIEISPTGWMLADDLPHAFIRDENTGPLPIPEETIEEPLTHLRELLAIHDDESWTNILSWLANALRPCALSPCAPGYSAACPILVINGPAGSGKSTLARMLKALIDPSPAAEGHLRIVDSPARIPPNLADASDQQPTILIAPAHRLTAQIAHRALTVNLPERTACRTLQALRLDFAAIHPSVLAALCTIVSRALRGLSETTQSTYPRLAEASAWVAAGAVAAASATAVARYPDPPPPPPASPDTVSPATSNPVSPHPANNNRNIAAAAPYSPSDSDAAAARAAHHCT